MYGIWGFRGWLVMSYRYPDPPTCCSSASAELKLYQAFIFSIPIIFTFVLLFLFYLFYLRRRTGDSSSLRMGTSNGNIEPLSIPSQFGLKKELREMLPIIVFKESFSVKDTQCSVCLGDYQAEDKLQQIPACGHIFHMDCIGHWLATHTTCPLCRISLLPSPKTTTNPSDDLVELLAHEAQSDQEFTRIGNADETYIQVQTMAERVNVGEERGSNGISNEEEFPDARREVERCRCGGEVSAVVLNVETHDSIEQELGSEHP
ncbi:RING-H2 finger protein ATL7-like [Macadamia integrifolia]|uniref:RING-H2 finger protein ATL7-like n=1 Tax=Macadamia integrifolia TaxID=60698 RepID=UPI001C4F8A93|nr:RING-H2 finger protein ATL7-like [Macadamia integrifolia]